MAAISSHSLPSISSHLYPSQPQKFRKTLPPIFISTNPSHLNLHQLAHLFASTNFSCHRFPNPDAQTGRVEPVDPGKLRTAVDHSSVVVSVFCREEFCEGGGGKEDLGFGGLLMERAVPVSEKNGRLVGFGRAVSDGGLTAAIYDVVVIPSLQRLGIGRRIVKRIIRVLTSRGIYDIAALCSEEERLFFEACGFGEDALGSTTMMYTRSASNYAEGNPSVRRVGRMLLLVPPLRKSSSENAASG
ncbi:GCN5-related N-acetyltransferase 3, chloroplastic isoform X1 [Magnolia sinica]|uniref:GCN5-related N-acetyltransferase 3, chloroplastic isoform X1 n=1 Tax=Magnolia sinica TaxID=86752 RepID=UPI0026596DDE|nr:GCN5-related N-acetyltransferase 3, chloroplastic isoform X1 [Magnolia sinica]